MKHRHSTCGLSWSHQHITVSHLKQLEVSLPADLRLTETEVQSTMEYAEAKIEVRGSDCQAGQTFNGAKSADKSTVKSSLLDQQEHDAETGQHGVL